MAEQVRGPFARERHAVALEESLVEKAEWPSVREAARRKARVDEAKREAVRGQNAVLGKQGRERSQAEREAKRLHDEEMLAVVAYREARLGVTADEFDRVLAETLDVDDHVDLEDFRRVAVHPPFGSVFFAELPTPDPEQGSPEPVWVEPERPIGLVGLFGQRKYREQWSLVRTDFEQRWMAWQAEAAQLPARQLKQMREHHAAEAERQSRLAGDRARYDGECRLRQAVVDESNAALDDLIARHGAWRGLRCGGVLRDRVRELGVPGGVRALRRIRV